MSDHSWQCPKCGYFFDVNANPYFSADHASYFSDSPVFQITWCFHCTSVSFYERPFLAKVLRAPVLRHSSTLDMSEARSNPLFLVKDRSMGLFAGAHVLRMVWHCLSAQVKLEHGEDGYQERTVHLGMRKLPPEDFALMVVITSQARIVVPLEQQIQEGMYLEDDLPMPLIDSFVSSFPDAGRAEIARQAIAHYQT